MGHLLRRAAPLLMLAACAGTVSLVGWRVGQVVSSAPTSDTLTITQTQVRTHTRTRLVKRVVHGRIGREPSGLRVLYVPEIVVHTQTRTIRVPAHKVPLRSVTKTLPSGALTAAVIARPTPVTVTVSVPVPYTVRVPYVTTQTVTTSTTVTVPTTITISLPLPSEQAAANGVAHGP